MCSADRVSRSHVFQVDQNVLDELPDDVKSEVLQALQQKQQAKSSAAASVTSLPVSDQPGCSHWSDSATSASPNPKVKMMSLKQVRDDRTKQTGSRLNPSSDLSSLFRLHLPRPNDLLANLAQVVAEDEVALDQPRLTRHPNKTDTDPKT